MVMLVASAKTRSARGASHHPTYMASCLTISHTCLLCLTSGRTLILERCFGHWEGDELRKLEG